MSNKLRFLFFLIFGLVMTAIISRNGTVMLITLPFVAYILVGYWQTPVLPQLGATRVIDKASSIAGQPLIMELTLQNLADAEVSLVVSDKLHPGVQILDGQFCQSACLSGGEKLSLRYTCCADRGLYHWQTLTVMLHDPFYLFESMQDIPAQASVLVQPEIVRLKHIPLRPANTLHSTGSFPARVAGSGIDFWGVREYQSGDSMRRLNWRKTARCPQKLFTKEFEQEETIDIGLILDTRMPAEFHTGQDSLFEYAVNAAASLAELFLREGNRVGLLVFGQEMNYLLPGYGKRQFHQVMRSLSAARPGANIALSNISYLRHKLFPGRSQLYMVSANLGDDGRAYRDLRAAGHPLVLISPDPVAYFSGLPDGKAMHPQAIRAARLERILQLQQLLHYGIRVINWPVTHSLNEVIHNAYKQFDAGSARNGLPQ
jgi:uncharacterized protein (DUF58 family)